MGSILSTCRERLACALLVIFPMVLCFYSCDHREDSQEFDPLYNFDSVLSESRDFFYTTLHGLSEQLYDGPANGTWGEKTFGYKMALRDIYWRVEAYHFLGTTDPSSPGEYLQRRDEALAYLKSIQRIQGDKGVWGVPADDNNPEFGSLIQQIAAEHPDYFSNGFLVFLPGDEISQLYYDHGRTLTAFCKVYLDTQDAELLPFIERGANWILDKPAVDNVNYNSAVIEGLAFAYQVTQIPSYLDKAIDMTKGKVISQSNSNGSFGDSHNQEAWYHGFIVSGFVALKEALPTDHSFHTVLDLHLGNALDYLETVTDPGSPYAFQWPGINARVWSEVEDLSATGRWPTLNAHQMDAYANCLHQTMHGEIRLEDEAGFRLQKTLYHFIQIGNAL